LNGTHFYTMGASGPDGVARWSCGRANLALIAHTTKRRDGGARSRAIETATIDSEPAMFLKPKAFHGPLLGLLATAHLLWFTPAAAAETAAPRKVGNAAVLTYGKDGGPQARLSFNKNRAATAALTVETIATGKAGSRLQIFTDGDPRPALEHTFIATECSSTPGGQGCTVRFKGRSSTYGRLSAAFRNGRVSSLEVATDGAMAMSETLELAPYRGAMPR